MTIVPSTLSADTLGIHQAVIQSGPNTQCHIKTQCTSGKTSEELQVERMWLARQRRAVVKRDAIACALVCNSVRFFYSGF